MKEQSNSRESGIIFGDHWLGAQEINGLMCIIRNAQVDGRDIDPKLISDTVFQIKLWGGLEKIEHFLQTNDPGHGRPSGITDMDWSWLPEELRLIKK